MRNRVSHALAPNMCRIYDHLVCDKRAGKYNGLLEDREIVCFTLIGGVTSAKKKTELGSHELPSAGPIRFA